MATNASSSDVTSATAARCSSTPSPPGFASAVQTPRCRLESTPTVARAVESLDADAGIVVTASHNPATDNGIKLWTPSAKAFGPEQRDSIERRIREADYDLVRWDELGQRRSRGQVRANHAAAIADAVSFEPADAPTVIVDLGNGAGGVTRPCSPIWPVTSAR